MIFGLDSKLFLDKGTFVDTSHTEEVETLTIYRGSATTRPHSHTHGESCDHTDCNDEAAEHGEVEGDMEDILTSALAQVSKDSVWRIKGFVRLTGEGGGIHILNWSFGRYELTELKQETMDGVTIKLTVMGEPGEVRRRIRSFVAAIGAEII